MSRSVKIRVILFFVTAVLSVCCSVGGLVSIFAVVRGIDAVFAFKACLTTNTILAALALIQAHSLLKLPTIN